MTNYTKQDYERDLQIVADAPEGATHADNVPSFYKMDSHGLQWGIWKGCWCVSVGCNTMRMPPSMRSLQDIRDKIAMYEANQKLIAVIQNMITDEADYVYDEDDRLVLAVADDQDNEHIKACMKLLEELTND